MSPTWQSPLAASALSPALLRPDWAAPPQVGAAMSLRDGWPAEPDALRQDLPRWSRALGAQPVLLRQVHGADVVRLEDADEPTVHAMHAAHSVHAVHAADASWTTRRGLACTVLTADCLPVLLCDEAATGVAAAHAGWRGLAAGVIEATVSALLQGTGRSPGELLAWLGPCIGPQAFEVGADVFEALGTSERARACFAWSPRPDGSPRWRADLQGLARLRLQALGVERVWAQEACTVSDASRFFSFRRDGLTGRMATSIWLN